MSKKLQDSSSELLLSFHQLPFLFLMTRYIEEPIRSSKDNKFSFKRLEIMGSVNVLLIASLLIEYV